MNRLDRLTAILIQLQSKKIVKAKEIAERFDISLRTVYRDIRALENAGVPVGAEAGLGYFLVDGYQLPPVMFSQDEAASLLLSAKLAEQYSDSDTAAHQRAALYKIQAVLRNSEKDFLASLESRVKVYRDFPLPKERSHLIKIQEALSHKKKIVIDYTSQTKGETTKRIISPIGLCMYGSSWHIIAFCELRKNYRDFRADRIESFQLTDQDYDPKEFISMDEYFEQGKKQENLHRIVLTFKKNRKPFIGDQKYYMGFVEESEDDSYYKMIFLSPMLNAFSRWILGFGNSVHSIEPLALKERVIQHTKELSEHYL